MNHEHQKMLESAASRIKQWSHGIAVASKAREILFPLTNQIVHFHGLSSTWCASISPLIKIGRISRVRVELKLNSTPICRTGASQREYAESHIARCFVLIVVENVDTDVGCDNALVFDISQG